MQIFGGIWRISLRGIQINEGGYLMGMTWLFGRIFDAWFKLPLRRAKSHRFTRWPKTRFTSWAWTKQTGRKETND
ncbi:hypothetical protein [Paraburkholderia sp. SIMBA_054]|uniref:hypothetical protein n=1 Tax=Paraburkholderia sp. SIMBA_054 TaxID=3085795 RepID=UPI0039789708